MRTLPLRTLLLATFPLAASAAACSSGADPGSGPGGATSSSSAAATGGAGGTAATTSTSATGGAGGAEVEPAGVFVAVGYGGRRIRSIDDGLTWINDASLMFNGGDDLFLLRTIAWGNGLFVAAGWRIMTSPDGITWKDTPPDSFNQNWIGQIAHGGGSFVGLGGYGSRVASADAVTWTQHSIDTIATHAEGGLAFAKGKVWVSVNDSGDLSHSADGVAWVYASTNLGAGTHAVAYGNGTFVAIGDGGAVTSTDGLSWSSPTAFAGAASLKSLLFAQGHFTVLAPDHVYTSNDGVAWVDHEAKNLNVGAAVYGHGTYVALQGNTVWRSNDSITWTTTLYLGGPNSLSRIAFGPK